MTTPRVLCDRSPWTGTPGLLPASDSERGGRRWLRAGPGGLVPPGMPRWCSAMCRGFCPSSATTSLTAGRVGDDARGMPGNPSSHPGFPGGRWGVPGTAWLLALGTITAAVRACAAETAHAPALLTPTECRGPPSTSPSADTVRRAALPVRPRVHRPCFSARRETVGISPVCKNFARTRDREAP